MLEANSNGFLVMLIWQLGKMERGVSSSLVVLTLQMNIVQTQMSNYLLLKLILLQLLLKNLIFS